MSRRSSSTCSCSRRSSGLPDVVPSDGCASLRAESLAPTEDRHCLASPPSHAKHKASDAPQGSSPSYVRSRTVTVMKVCIEPRCRRLTMGARCAPCQSDKDRARNQASYYQTPEWRTMAQACIERDGNCMVCTSTSRMTANHIIGRAAGGPDTVENLMTMCGRCHSTFEADTRNYRSTDLRRRVDEIRAALICARDLRPQGAR